MYLIKLATRLSLVDAYALPQKTCLEKKFLNSPEVLFATMVSPWLVRSRKGKGGLLPL